MATHTRRWMARSAFACCLLCRIAVAAPSPPPPQRVDLLTDVAAAGDLAAPANGQTLYVLDELRGVVVAVDPFEPTKRWQAVAPGPRGTVARSIACIDTSMIALLCRTADGWSLQTHRLQPGVVADPGKPAQTLAVGTTRQGAEKDALPPSGQEECGCLFVSPSRDWLGVCGLPSPLPPVLRAPIAGSRVGTISARGCPVPPPTEWVAAATISMAEEFVLFIESHPGAKVANLVGSQAGPPPGKFPATPAGRSPGSVFVSFHLPPDARPLLRLDTSLPRVRDAAFCRTDGTLWVVGGEAGNDLYPEGLWRIDGVLQAGRQAARAVCIARLDGARSVVCLSEKAVIVTHGRGARTVSRIDPTHPASIP